MHQRWQLQQAKAKLSEVVERAISDGPQIITRHGKDAVVVVAAEEFGQGQRPQPRVPLGEFLYNSPLRGSDLKLERAKDQPRPTPTFD